MVLFLQEDKNKKSNQNKKLSISNTDHKGPSENELLIVEMTNNNKDNEDKSDDEEDEM